MASPESPQLVIDEDVILAAQGLISCIADRFTVYQKYSLEDIRNLREVASSADDTELYIREAHHDQLDRIAELESSGDTSRADQLRQSAYDPLILIFRRLISPL